MHGITDVHIISVVYKELRDIGERVAQLVTHKRHDTNGSGFDQLPCVGGLSQLLIAAPHRRPSCNRSASKSPDGKWDELQLGRKTTVWTHGSWRESRMTERVIERRPRQYQKQKPNEHYKIRVFCCINNFKDIWYFGFVM